MRTILLLILSFALTAATGQQSIQGHYTTESGKPSTSTELARSVSIKGFAATGNKFGAYLSYFVNNKNLVALGFQFNHATGGRQAQTGMFRKHERVNNGKRFFAEYRYLFMPEENKLLYLAAKSSLGRHEARYNNGMFDSALFGALFNSDYAGGEASVLSGGNGLKVGFESIKNSFVFDLSMGLVHNYVLGNTKGVTLSDGSLVPFDKHLNGFNIEVTLSMGFISNIGK